MLMEKFGIPFESAVGIEKNDPPFFPLLLYTMVDYLTVILRAHTGQIFTLCFGDTDFFVSFTDFARQVLPTLTFPLSRFDIVVNVIVIKLGKIRSPSRLGF